VPRHQLAWPNLLLPEAELILLSYNMSSVYNNNNNNNTDICTAYNVSKQIEPETGHSLGGSMMGVKYKLLIE